ncbi:hypothetical protein ACXPWS_23350 [Mycobacterium sp. BMJ-28]
MSFELPCAHDARLLNDPFAPTADVEDVDVTPTNADNQEGLVLPTAYGSDERQLFEIGTRDGLNALDRRYA